MMMKENIGRVFGAIAVVAALGAFTPTEAEAQCTDCPRCGIQSMHKAPAGGTNAAGLHPEICLAPVGCTGHPPCIAALPVDQMRQENFDKLLDQARLGDFVATLAMLRTFHEQAIINAERQALQVYTLPGCDAGKGKLIAHIPLTRTQVAMATDWQARRLVALLAANQP